MKDKKLNSKPHIEIENLCLSRNTKLFENFSHSFEPSLIHGILGPSGSGKTSLLHAISGLLPFQEGRIKKDKTLSYLFQEPRLLPWLSIEKNLSIVIENQEKNKSLRNEKVYEMLKKVQLIQYAKSFPNQLSGGEKQRLALARAFLFPSSLLLMDEAFQSQDIILKLELMDLLQELHREDKRTILMVSHDIREALSLSDTLIVLKGRPIEKQIIYTSKNNTHSKASETYVHFTKDLQEKENFILQIFSKPT